jgi:transposase
MISRDRSNEYAKGVAEGAPQAIQVADRWHLVKNLREALEQYLEENRAYLRAAAGPIERPAAASDPRPQSSVPVSSNTLPTTPDVETPARPQTPAEQARQVKRIRRKERYQAVLGLYQQGIGIREIARKLGVARDTVRHYVRAGEFPEWAQRQEKKPGKLTPFVPYLEQRWQAGCHNRMQLWREICQQGFDGTPRLVSSWAARKRVYNEPSIDGAGVRTNSPSWAANKAVWLLMKATAELNQEEQQALQRMK